MNTWQMLTLVAVMALAVLLFPAHKPTPRYILFLGKFLPFAIMGLLIVYCLKGVCLVSYPFGLPEAIALAYVAAVHIWKKNTLLSIGGGTLLYMLLVQVVFR